MKISIVTACKNSHKVIALSLDSILFQSYKNIEHILIEGQSTDQTLKIINKYKRRNFFVYKEPDKGIYDAMNKGIRNATGDIIYFLNAGDIIFDTDTVSKVIKIFTSQNTDLVIGDSIILFPVSGKTKIKRHRSLSKAYLYFNTINHQAIFARRVVFERFGNFNTTYKIMADYDWQLRMAENCVKTTYVHFPVVIYRNDGISSMSSETLSTVHAKERKEIINRHYSTLERLQYSTLTPIDYLRRSIFHTL